jgi:hypothetical protein
MECESLRLSERTLLRIVETVEGTTPPTDDGHGTQDVELSPAVSAVSEAEDIRLTMAQDASSLSAWYNERARYVAGSNGEHSPSAELVASNEASRSATVSVDPSRSSAATLSVRGHLAHLRLHLRDLLEPAAAVARAGRHPWWH